MVPARLWPTASQALAHADRRAVAPLTWDPNSLLLSRFTFGATQADRAALAAQGVDAWWQAQVAYGRAHLIYEASPSIKAVCPMLSQTPAQIKAYVAANPNQGWIAMDQLSNMTIGLQTWSPAQLYETVVDFFGNHLNVANHTADVYLNRHTMDRDVIRRHAFGTFTDMLLASTRNPAMLTYLSQNLSTKSAVNENLGRELLELHTVGLGARYTENDVQNSARILTGRTVDQSGNYVYNPSMHWVGPVTVLGFSHANSTAAGGEAVGDAYLRYLAMHPSTASRIAGKLCVRYVSDTPSAELVASVAQAYLANGSAIEPTLRAIITSSEFWASRGRKTRRPAENMVASVRALGLQPVATGLAAGLTGMHWTLTGTGHSPLDCPVPPGYPDMAKSWRSCSSLLTIWMWHRGFAQNWWPTWFSAIDLTTLYGSTAPTTSGAAIDALARRLLGQPMTPAHQSAIQALLGEPATTLLSKSMMRWYLSYVVAAILDSPYHALR